MNSRKRTRIFTAYQPDGEFVEVVYQNHWEEDQLGMRERRERDYVERGLIVPTYSCAASCILAAFQAGRPA